MCIQLLSLASLCLHTCSGSDPNSDLGPEALMRRATDGAQNAVAALSREHLAAVESRLSKFEKISSQQMAAEKAKIKSIEDKHKSHEQAMEEKLETSIAGLQNRIDALTLNASWEHMQNHTKASVKPHYDSASEFGDEDYYYTSSTTHAAPTLPCRCIGGDTIGAECTRSNHHKKWCYVSDVRSCKHFATGVSGQWSEDPCNADRSGAVDPFSVPQNFNRDEYQGPCPPADPICTGQNETSKEELDEEIIVTEEMIMEVANYRCCENRTTSNVWKWHLKQKKVPPYCKETWFKAHCLDVNGNFMPSEGSPAPNLTDMKKLDECEVCNSCFKTKTKKTGKQKCKFWGENQVSIPDRWTKAISDEAIQAHHNGEDLTRFTNATKDDDELAEECDGPFSNKDGETCSNFYIAAHMYPVVTLAAASLLVCLCGMGAYAYYGDQMFVMVGMKPKLEEPQKPAKKSPKKAHGKRKPRRYYEEDYEYYQEDVAEEPAQGDNLDDVLADLDEAVADTKKKKRESEVSA